MEDIRYRPVVYLRSGQKIESGATNMKSAAVQEAQMIFDQRMRVAQAAGSDYIAPTRWDVEEVRN